MRIVFISNFINHHQLPLSYALKSHLDCEEYTFIATTPTDRERIALGYEDGNKNYDFVCCAYDSDDEMNRAQMALIDADVVIWGSAPYDMVRERLDAGKLTYRYSERILKNGVYPLLKKKNRDTFEKYYGQYREKPFYLLATGAYAAKDYERIHAFPYKKLTWGYFPPYIETEFKNEKDSRIEIVWCARFITWKHPESMLYMAKYLKKYQLDFHITMIGNGELLDEMKKRVEKSGLNDYIALVGGISADKVRPYMDKADILVFTSDKKEGWGAVLNEGMNSACVPVVSHEIGATPYLVQNGKNGLLFKSKNWKHMSEKVKYLIENPEERKRMSQEAYKTVKDEWNAKNAADSLIEFSKTVLSGNPKMPKTGPCSEAPVLKISDVKKNL